MRAYTGLVGVLSGPACLFVFGVRIWSFTRTPATIFWWQAERIFRRRELGMVTS